MKAKFTVQRKLNDGMPSRSEARWAYENAFVFSKTTRSNTEITNALYRYGIDGLPIEIIAKTRGVTRERIRQLILKGCREAWKR